MSFFSKFSGYLTGITHDSVETPSSAHINGAQVKMAPGLKFCDGEGLKTARRAGWIMSMNMLRANKIHENDEYYWDILPETTLQLQMATMGNALLKLEAKRQGSVALEMCSKERIDMMIELHGKLLDESGLAKEYMKEGYIVLRSASEERFSNIKEVNHIMEQFERNGAYPPVIVTKDAMATLAFEINLFGLNEKVVQEKDIAARRPAHTSNGTQTDMTGIRSEVTKTISSSPFAKDIGKILQKNEDSSPELPFQDDPTKRFQVIDLEQELQRVCKRFISMVAHNESARTNQKLKKNKTLTSIRCLFCDKKGHKWRKCQSRARDCPSWKPNKKPDDDDLVTNWSDEPAGPS